MSFRLEQNWRPEGDANGTLTLVLINAGDGTPGPARLCFGSTTMPRADAVLTGGRLGRSIATHQEIALDPTPGPGQRHEITIRGLSHRPSNRTHGALAAWLELEDGSVRAVDCGDLQPPEGTARGPVRDWPEGRVEVPVSILPWPAEVRLEGFGPAPLLVPGPGCDAAPFIEVMRLNRRLFPAAPAPFALTGGAGATEVTPRLDDTLPAEGYRLQFGAGIGLVHADAAGLRHGLIVLAQIAHAARNDARFAFPAGGEIADAPRFEWRGCHFDVARNFHGVEVVTRLLDILAWLRMNRLHWHLTDDEGWRLPSRAFPDLNRAGARRVRGGHQPPQYADGPAGQSGHYTEADIAAVLAHAGKLGIAVMPEIDIPGHCTALMAAVPGLRDPGEPEESYRSIQQFPNNALNPGLARTYVVVETLLAEAARLFPGARLHIGGDEVDARTWAGSPAAQALAQAEGLAGTPELQAHFMRRAQAMVAGLGRDLGAWDEAADGGGIAPENTLLFAWRSVGKTAELIAAGYDVVATPGQAYYLDMVQGAGWDSPGAAWAGIATPESTYRFDPAEGLPDGPGRLIGVQAGIWTEHLNTVARLNDMLFPRLSAVAEAGWTPQAGRDWPRFAALSKGLPTL